MRSNTDGKQTEPINPVQQVVAPKYRNVETSDAWSDRGKPPRGLSEAEAAGKIRESFLIKIKQAKPLINPLYLTKIIKKLN